VDVQSYEELKLWNYVPAPELVGGGILEEQAGLMLFGHPKTFKSLLAQQLAISLVCGIPWLNFPTVSKRILYIQAEIPKAAFRSRLMKMGANIQGMPTNAALFSTTFVTKLDKPAGRDELLRAVTQFQPDVTFLDPMYRFMSSSGEDSVIKVLDVADELKSVYRQAVVIALHARKSRINTIGQLVDSGGGEMRGPLVEAWADSIIRVQGDIDTDERVLSFELRNAPALLKPFKIKLDRNKLWFKRA